MVNAPAPGQEGRTLSENAHLYEAEGGDAGFACVAFGGIAQGIGVPVFEFFRTLTAAGISSLFIKDPAQGWYQNPIPDLGATPQDMARRVSEMAREHLPGKRIVAIGNSMGGYAAMMFSCLCGFERAVAFSPQTFIQPAMRAQHKDSRWQDRMDRIGTMHIGDLRPLLAAHRVQVDIYAGEQNPLDMVHARHLSGLEGVTLNLLPECGHNASAWLRDQGRLDRIIREAGFQR